MDEEQRKAYISSPEYQKWHAAAIQHEREWHSHLLAEICAWGMETIKHIALISLAGLAGVFALLSTGNRITVMAAKQCGICFAVASGLCVLGMYFAYQCRMLYAEHQVRIINKLYKFEVISEEEHARPKVVLLCGYASDIAGWLAAAVVAYGGYLLFGSISS